MGIINPFACGFIKLTFFIQYHTLFWPLRWARINVWVGSILSVLFYASTGIAGMVCFSPRPGESMQEVISQSQFNTSLLKIVAVMPAIGVLVDLELLLIPFCALSILQMERRKKIGLLVLFMVGVLYVIVSATTNRYFNQRTALSSPQS